MKTVYNKESIAFIPENFLECENLTLLADKFLLEEGLHHLFSFKSLLINLKDVENFIKFLEFTNYKKLLPFDIFKMSIWYNSIKK